MAKQTLPFMYRQSIEGMQQILTECWARYRGDSNMLALRLALDSHEEIFNQAANGVSVLAVKKNREGQYIGYRMNDITVMAIINYI